MKRVCAYCDSSFEIDPEDKRTAEKKYCGIRCKEAMKKKRWMDADPKRKAKQKMYLKKYQLKNPRAFKRNQKKAQIMQKLYADVLILFSAATEEMEKL